MDAKDEAREVFRIMDKDLNGRLAEGELADGLRCMGLNPSLKDVKRLLQEFDKDKDGVLGFEEFVMMYQKFSGEKVGDEVLLEQFRELDVNGDGVVDLEELRMMLASGEEALSEAEVREVMRDFDKDGNGKIELEEFIQEILGRG